MLHPQDGGFPRAIKRIDLGDKEDTCLQQQQQGKHRAYAGEGVGSKAHQKNNKMTYEHCLKEVRVQKAYAGLSVHDTQRGHKWLRCFDRRSIGDCLVICWRD